MAIRATGTLSSSERVGAYTRTASISITGRTDWNGNNPIDVYSLNWAISAQNSTTLYARLSITNGVTAKNSAFLSLPSSSNGTGTPAAKSFALTSTPYNANNTSFTVTANVYANSTGTTRTNNVLESVSTTDDTRMGKNSATIGDYWASIWYYQVSVAPTNVSVASNGTSVTWSAPSDNGDTAITGHYVYTVNPGSSNAYDNLYFTGSSANSYTLATALAAGAKVKVTAVNAVGESQYSVAYTIPAPATATVPNYNTTTYSTWGTAAWANAGFTGSISRNNTVYSTSVLADVGNFVYQDQTAGSNIPVTSSMTVYYYYYVAPTYSVTYNGNGNTSGAAPIDSSTYTSSANFVTRNQGTLLRTNYSFLGWNTNSSATTANYAASTTYAMPASNLVLYAIWAISTITPVFTDTTLSTPATLGVAYSDGVSATNAISYSVISGSLPLGLSLATSTGLVTGTPTTQGSYTFAIRATSSTSTNTDSANIIINIYPPGIRPSTSTRLTTAKRFIGIGASTTNAQGVTIPADANGYVNLSRMMVYKAGQWTPITNI